MARGQAGLRGVARFGPFELRPAERLLLRDGAPLAIGSRALDILVALVEGDGEVLSRRDLIARAWPGLIVEESNLRFHISALRKALGDGQPIRYVENVVGRGYCFVASIAWSAPRRDGAEAGPAEETALKPLPTPGQRIIGRDDALRDIAALLAETRFVSIVAPGGMGKTTTALAVARELLPAFDERVAFIDFSTIAHASQVPAAIASGLGLDDSATDAMAAVGALVERRRILLVLDNCEHVADAAAEACERIAAAGPDAHLLTTSREALRAIGEHVFHLAPLALPPDDADLDADAVLRYPAVQLFADRARTSGHAGVWSDADARRIARLCARLDGIALAIELVASRVGAYGLQGVADLIDETCRLRWPGRRGAVDRHQTLEAMLDWSFNLLRDDERTVLLRLAIFRGPFTLQAAHRIVPAPGSEGLDVAGALTGLVDKSLIWIASGASPVHFRLLETTQAYAAARLAAVPDHDAVALRHARYWLARLIEEGTDAAMFGAQEVRGYMPHVAGLRAALDWAAERPAQRGLFVQLAAYCAPIFRGLSLLDECATWCGRALAQIGPDEQGTITELLLLEGLAITSMFARGNQALVESAIERGLVLAEQLGLVEHQLHLLAGQNIFFTRVGALRTTLAHGPRNAAIAAAAGTPAALAMVEWMIAVSAHLAGNQRCAFERAERGFAHAAQDPGRAVDYFGFDHRVRALVALARTLWLRGDALQAMARAEEAVACADARGRPVSQCIALIYSATVALASDALDRAAAWIGRAEQLAARYALGPYSAVAMGLRGQLLVRQGEVEAGMTLLRQALAAFHQEEHHVLTVSMQAGLAEALVAAGYAGEAQVLVEGALQRAEAAGGDCEEPRLCLLAATIASGDGSEAEARRWLERARARAAEQSAFHYALAAAVRLAEAGPAPEDRAALADDIETLLATLPASYDAADRRHAAGLAVRLRR